MSPMDVDALSARIGQEIGVGEWFRITQDRVDAFADATLDQQWIHQAGAAAAAGPFGGPIAHGFLILSLLSHLKAGMPALGLEARMVINYGLDRVRFITPVRVGSRIRARGVLSGLERAAGGVQVKVTFTIELEGAERPAAVVESLTRLYD